MTGTVSTKPVDGLVLTIVAAQAPLPAAYAVFDTAVFTQTVPTVPVIVNVNAWPRPRLVALFDQPKSVPELTVVIDAAPNAAGWSPAAPATTGESVSVTTRFVIVIVPVLATTIRYVTCAPVPGAPGVCSFDTVSPVTGAGSTAPTGFVVSTVVEHALEAITKPVFDTARSAHTTPYRPEIVNVVVVPG
jgi:hypothetical protein